MTDDEMDAESRRYSINVMKVLPLVSGRIAVLGLRNEIYRIVDTWAEAIHLGPEIYEWSTIQSRKHVVEISTEGITIDDQAL